MANTMGRRGVVWKTPTVTADGLKLFATIMMVIANFGIAIVQNGMIHLERYTQASLSEAMENDSHLMMLAGFGVVMQLLGGLAVTLFAFLLVEGFRSTSDYKKYLLRMLFFAVISEIPYDLAVHQRILEFSGQNALFTLVVCLIMLYFLDAVKDGTGLVPGLIRVIIVTCSVGWVSIFRMAYGFCMVLLVAVLYLFYAKNVLKTFLGIIISLLYVTGPLAFYGIWCYNGVRKDRIPKYAFYVIYPLHLLVFGLIVRIFMQ